MLQFLLRCVVLALGITLAATLIPGIHCDSGSTLVAVVAVLTICNSVLKPLLVLLTLPFILLTMGLGMMVINAFLFYIVGHIVKGFSVDHFFWSAVGGSLVVSATDTIASLFLRQKTHRRPERRDKPDDVIDI